jgi:hypothetical protein
LKWNFKSNINHPVPIRQLADGTPLLQKEGKVMIYNNIHFSSSLEESLPRLSGEYPDRKVRGRWCNFNYPFHYGPGFVFHSEMLLLI